MLVHLRKGEPFAQAAAGIIPPSPQGHRVALAEAEPGRQALLVLAHLRKGETFAELAAGFEVGTTTAWRYVTETTGLLAARARQAVRDAVKAGRAYVVLDGTLIPADRVAADRPFYSGKHCKPGMNPQVIASPAGTSSGCPERCPDSPRQESEWTGEYWPRWTPPGHPGR